MSESTSTHSEYERTWLKANKALQSILLFRFRKLRRRGVGFYNIRSDVESKVTDAALRRSLQLYGIMRDSHSNE